MVEGLLKMAEIPVVGKVKGFHAIDGGFMHVFLGSSVPVEILVPEDRLEEAVQLLNAKVEDESLNDDQNNDSIEADESKQD